MPSHSTPSSISNYSANRIPSLNNNNSKESDMNNNNRNSNASIFNN